MDVIDKLRNSYLTDDHNTTIVSSDIHDFDKMMHTILMIVEDRLRFVDCVYLNLTKGSGEFCSAAITTPHQSVYAILKEGGESDMSIVWIAGGIAAILIVVAVAFFVVRSGKAKN